MDLCTEKPFRAQKAVFDKLEKVVALASLTRDERAKYDENLKILRSKLSEIAFAQEKGKAEGIAERKAEEKRR